MSAYHSKRKTGRVGSHRDRSPSACGRFKHGQFGYGKYVYPDNVMDEIREFFERQSGAVLPHARILYIV
ncbi:MAG: hypothetical protein H5T95_08225 [Firmicutes bacterium]|nr:hypothetical protein [Bacillota bacterium]